MVTFPEEILNRKLHFFLCSVRFTLYLVLISHKHIAKVITQNFWRKMFKLDLNLFYIFWIYPSLASNKSPIIHQKSNLLNHSKLGSWEESVWQWQNLRRCVFPKFWYEKQMQGLFDCGPSSSTALHKNMKFSIKDFFSKCDQICSFRRIWSQDLVAFTEEILNGKIHFLSSTALKLHVLFTTY